MPLAESLSATNDMRRYCDEARRGGGAGPKGNPERGSRAGFAPTWAHAICAAWPSRCPQMPCAAAREVVHRVAVATPQRRAQRRSAGTGTSPEVAIREGEAVPAGVRNLADDATI